MVRLRTSKNLLIHKVNKTQGNLVKMSYFRTLKIDPNHLTIQELFIQEKWLNLNKNNELHDILARSVPIPVSPAQRETYRLTASQLWQLWEPVTWQPQREARWVLSSLIKPCFQKIVIVITWLAQHLPGNLHLLGLSLFDLTQSLLTVNSLLPG